MAFTLDTINSPRGQSSKASYTIYWFSLSKDFVVDSQRCFPNMKYPLEGMHVRDGICLPTVKIKRLATWVSIIDRAMG